MPLTFEATRAHGATLGSGVIMVFDETADLVDTLRRIAQFFRDESCGQCVPCRVGTVRQEELLARLAAGSRVRLARRGAGPPARDRPGDARRVDLRPRPDGVVGDRVRPAPARTWWRCERRPEHGSRPGARRADAARRPGLGRPAADRHPADAACPGEPAADRAGRRGAARRRADDRRGRGHGPGRDDDPRRLPNPGDRHPDPVLRREPDAGQRLPGVRRRGRRLARAGPGLLAQGRGRDGRPDRLRTRPAVAQDGPRVPRLVGRPVAGRADRPGRLDRGLRRALRRGSTRYGPPAAPAAAGERDTHEAGHHHAPAGDATAATVAQPTKVDNNLYVRDYSKCILCYKCVDACGEEAQNTFAIAVAGRGFDARISTEQAVPLPESACVYCGNCIGVCPTGALMFKSEYDMREAGHLGRVGPDRDRDDLPVLRRRLCRRAPRPGRPDRQGDLADGLLGDRGPPVHQGPLRLRVRQQPPRRVPRLVPEVAGRQASRGRMRRHRAGSRQTGCRRRT